MKKPGFTLVELLIALSLAGLVMISGTFLLSGYLKTFIKNSAEIERLQVKQMVLSRLVREIRSAETLIEKLPGKITMKSGGSLVSYDLKDQKIRRKKDTRSDFLSEAGQIQQLSFSYPFPAVVIIKLDKFETGVFCRNAE